jgi:anti-sigma regulatory factor (Ser/Thr protein kinase)
MRGASRCDLEFGEQAAEKAAIVVTEACTNLLKHAANGQIIICRPLLRSAQRH